MQSNNRIHGISPMVISGFHQIKFRRYGTHPGRNRVMRNAFPKLTAIPFIKWIWLDYESEFIYNDDVRSAGIVIIGADGSWLKIIDFRTNQAAADAIIAAEAQLDQFLNNIQKDEQT